MTDAQRRLHGITTVTDRALYQKNWAYILDQVPARALTIALGQEDGGAVINQLEYLAGLLGLMNENTSTTIADCVGRHVDGIGRAALSRVDSALRPLFRDRASRSTIMLAAHTAGNPYLTPTAIRAHVERRLAETAIHIRKTA